MPQKSKYSDEDFRRQTVIIRKEYLKAMQHLAVDEEEKTFTDLLDEALAAYLKEKNYGIDYKKIKVKVTDKEQKNNVVMVKPTEKKQKDKVLKVKVTDKG